MVTPGQRDRLRRQVLAIRDTRPIFVLDFWNDGPYVDGCIAGARRYFHVNAKGDVEPCVYTHIAVDNIKEKTLKAALDSRLFRRIRQCQPHNANHLRPCMIIDNPHVMRGIIEQTGARFTHPGAEEIYTVHSDRMDAYAARWGEYADRIWETEYQRKEKSADAINTCVSAKIASSLKN
ncbi:MAG: SPASM domain-containing protein [Deltaproteobacteria bacterium]